MNDAISSVALFVPKLFLIILLIGYLVARVLARIVDKLLERVGFDHAVERGGAGRALARSNYDATDILAKLVFYAIMLFVLSTAFGVFGPNPISGYLQAVIAYLPLVFVALVIVVIASAIAAAVKLLVETSLGGLSYGRVLANVARGRVAGRAPSGEVDYGACRPPRGRRSASPRRGGAGRATRYRSGRITVTDIVALIKGQHRQMDALLDKAQQEGADSLGLLRRVSDLLLPHSEAEEDFVYPAIREKDSSEAAEVKDGTAEHHHIEQLMRELLTEDPGGPGYDGKLAAMIGELRHHVEEEEQDLLPVLSEKASDREREELGARFARATGRDHASPADTATRDELYQQAKDQDVPGRSTMTKEELAAAVDQE